MLLLAFSQPPSLFLSKLFHPHIKAPVPSRKDPLTHKLSCLWHADRTFCHSLVTTSRPITINLIIEEVLDHLLSALVILENGSAVNKMSSQKDSPTFMCERSTFSRLSQHNPISHLFNFLRCCIPSLPVRDVLYTVCYDSGKVMGNLLKCFNLILEVNGEENYGAQIWR